jgi:hypothetical protein
VEASSWSVKDCRSAELRLQPHLLFRQAQGGILDQFGDGPDVVGHPGGHRRRCPDRQMDFAEVVIGIVERHRGPESGSARLLLSPTRKVVRWLRKIASTLRARLP